MIITLARYGLRSNFHVKPNLYRYSLEDQFDIFLNEYKKLFPENKKYKRTLVMEITKNCNIHAHGIMYFDSRRQFFDKIRKNKVIGFAL